MDKKLREISNLSVEIMNSKRQVMGKVGHVVQIRVAVRPKRDAISLLSFCCTGKARKAGRSFLD